MGNSVSFENVQFTMVNVSELVMKRSKEDYDKMNIDINYTISDKKCSEKHLVIQVEFVISALEDKTNEQVFTIVFVLEAEFENKSGNFNEFELEDFEEFSKSVALPQIWPYVRELVSTLTTRMGVQTLTLPMMQTLTRG